MSLRQSMHELGNRLRAQLMKSGRTNSYWLVALVYVASYVILDALSNVQPMTAFGITPWSPPTGLTIALVTLFGARYLVVLPAAPLLADAIVRGLPLPTVLELASALTISFVYGAAALLLTTPRLRFNPALGSKRDLILLLGISALAALVAALADIGLLTVSGVIQPSLFTAAAIRFWIGDMIGITIMAPLILILMTRRNLPRLQPEMLLPLAMYALALWVVFGYANAFRFQLFYLLFLPVIWTAVRYSLEGVTWGLLITQVGLIVAIQLSTRPFDLTIYQALMIVLSITGLAVGMLVQEQQRTERELRLHQEALARVARLSSIGEFAATLAHEINQPLTAIGNYSRLLVRSTAASPLDAAMIREAATKASEQVERAAEVVRRLREFIRLGRSERSPTSVDALIEAAAEMCASDFERHYIKLEKRIAPNLGTITVDNLQMEQVLINLLRNSLEALVEAGRSGGQVEITAERDDRMRIVLSVKDNGPGFDPVIARTEPRPFTTTKVDGMGLGLALSRSIVEAHGGQLDIGGDHTGAMVSIALPANTPADEGKR